jgi:hypothetical protein
LTNREPELLATIFLGVARQHKGLTAFRAAIIYIQEDQRSGLTIQIASYISAQISIRKVGTSTINISIEPKDA